MNAVRNTATPQEVTTALIFGNLVTLFRRILTTGDAPSRLLKMSGKREPPNKLLKIQGRHKKDVINEGTSQ